MLKFTKLGENVNLIKEYIDQTEINFCDISQGVKYMWRDTVQVEYAVYNHTLILKEKNTSGRISFYYPMGKDVDGAILKIEEFCRAKKLDLVFGYLDEIKLKKLENRYYYTQNQKDRNWCDYIYIAENFKTYSGKKLSGQRNHVNKFKKSYPDYQFERLTAENLGDALAFLKEHNAKRERAGKIEELERQHAFSLTENAFVLNQVGGMIKVDGKVVAVSVGERVKDTLIVHVEKADTEYSGVYPTMAQEFAKEYATDGIVYINREEDCGDLGLRTSKMQYSPHEIKYKNFLSVYTLFDRIDLDLRLNTERLTVERIQAQDAKDYERLYTDDKLNALWGYDYRADLGENKPTPEYFFNFQQLMVDTKEEISFAVKQNGKMVGELVLHNFDYYGGLEMGFRFFENAQGKGYAIESATALKEYVFNELGAKTLKSRCYKQNEKSNKLIERLGLKICSEDKEKYYFSLER